MTNHYTPKVITTTGAGTIAAASVTDQVLTALLLGLAVVVAALVLRGLWRRNKSIGK